MILVMLSGRFVLRINASLHRRLKTEAAQQGVSLNQVCQSILEGPTRNSRNHPYGEYQTACEAEWGRELLGIVLFGSVARDEANAGSDVDLLIVVADSSPIRREQYRRWDRATSQLQTGKTEVNPQIVHLPVSVGDAGSLWFEVALEGIVLVENEFKVSRFLTQLRNEIVEGGMTRASSHGHRYWVRKKKAKEAS